MASREERKLAGSGGRLVALGARLVVIGVVLALLLNGTALGIGVAVAVLGAIPVIGGITLLLSGPSSSTPARTGRSHERSAAPPCPMS